MISIDTETTGLDWSHGSRPYFVTITYDNYEQDYFEWDVDPYTRKVTVPPSDIRLLQDHYSIAAGWGDRFDSDTKERHTLVFQNPKFDVTALETIGVVNCPWHMVRDTLRAGHILASNQPHDLTSMVLHYLGKDIQPYEDKVEEATKAARRIIQQARLKIKRHSDTKLDEQVHKLATWKIAEEGLEELPSASHKTWKIDMWLPRALAKELGYKIPSSGCDHTWHGWVCTKCSGHHWYTVLSDYSNADSCYTLLLWERQLEELKARNLFKIYVDILKVLPIAKKMERNGVTYSSTRLHSMQCEFTTKSIAAEELCKNIATSLGYDLDLPKGSNNDNLTFFCFGKPIDKKAWYKGVETKWLDLPVIKKTETGKPSLDKYVMEDYVLTLRSNSKQLAFIKALMGKRKRDTSLGFMRSYEKFGLPITNCVDYYVLHPNTNPTGTHTRRWTNENPNGQQISKQEVECEYCKGEGCEACHYTGLERRSVRYMFGPRPGRVWISADYENIELRIPAYVANEKAMIDLFERPNDPPYYGSNHLLNFHTVYPDIWEAELKVVGYDKVGPYCKKKYKSTWYQHCKNGGFCKQYGGQKRKTDATFHRVGAYDLIESRFVGLTDLNKKLINQADKLGYVTTLPDKTVDSKHGYPLMCTRTEYDRVLPTTPLSYMVQGTAMACTEKAMIRCDNQLEEWEGSSRQPHYITLQVHDELVFDLPYEDAATTYTKAQRLKQLMEQSGEDIGVPLAVSWSYHPNNWSESEELKPLV